MKRFERSYHRGTPSETFEPGQLRAIIRVVRAMPKCKKTTSHSLGGAASVFNAELLLNELQALGKGVDFLGVAKPRDLFLDVLFRY
jgi:hypothetical protein